MLVAGWTGYRPSRENVNARRRPSANCTRITLRTVAVWPRRHALDHLGRRGSKLLQLGGHLHVNSSHFSPYGPHVESALPAPTAFSQGELMADLRLDLASGRLDIDLQRRSRVGQMRKVKNSIVAYVIRCFRRTTSAAGLYVNRKCNGPPTVMVPRCGAPATPHN